MGIQLKHLLIINNLKTILQYTYNLTFTKNEENLNVRSWLCLCLHRELLAKYLTEDAKVAPMFPELMLRPFLCINTKYEITKVFLGPFRNC